jgi:hypothetical protein
MTAAELTRGGRSALGPGDRLTCSRRLGGLEAPVHHGRDRPRPPHGLPGGHVQDGLQVTAAQLGLPDLPLEDGPLRLRQVALVLRSPSVAVAPALRLASRRAYGYSRRHTPYTQGTGHTGVSTWSAGHMSGVVSKRASGMARGVSFSAT